MTQFPRAFVLHQCHGEPLSGVELPNGRVVVFDDPEGWLSTGASSADELLRCGYHGARIEWADQAQRLPTAVLLGTPCDACEHTLNWHRNDVGCTVPRCVCGRFQQPTT
ncbi:hypothetical protein [Streptomyces fimicarius]|uniref:hypothetical protein n=1 Tax=Streptomyces TaxID=1883 RepID=UPI0036A3E5C2